MGTLVLIGGAEDRTATGGILYNLVRMVSQPLVAIVPAATSYPRETCDDYRRVFEQLGAGRVETADIRNRQDAFHERYLRYLEEADIVFFTGGDQTRILNAFHETPATDVLKRRLHETLIISGTSAGAAAAGDLMIWDGDVDTPQPLASGNGMGWLPGFVVDTHFSERDKLIRLRRFLDAQKGVNGLGLDENTAMITRLDGTFEVVGEGTVTLVDRPDDPLQGELRIQRFRPGETFVCGDSSLQTEFPRPPGKKGPVSSVRISRDLPAPPREFLKWLRLRYPGLYRVLRREGGIPDSIRWLRKVRDLF